MKDEYDNTSNSFLLDVFVIVFMLGSSVPYRYAPNVLYGIFVLGMVALLTARPPSVIELIFIYISLPLKGAQA